MKLYNPKEPLFSIHMPKTGGTSFKQLLRSWYGRHLYYHYFQEKNNQPPLKVNTKKKKFLFFGTPELCIHGHFNNKRGTGVLDYYPTASQCITIVRDPLEIAISNYFYIEKLAKEGTSYRNGKVWTNNDSLDEYVKNCNSIIPLFMPKPVSEHDYKDVIDTYFIHIGILGNLKKTIEIFSEKLGKNILEVPETNISPRGTYPSESSIAEFKEKNKLAYLIYDYALELNE